VFCLRKARRLQNKHDYTRVFGEAKKFVTDELLLLHCRNSLGYARLGLAISKKMLAKSHQRNRIKRIIRESFRTHELPAIDVVVLARKGVALVPNQAISSHLSAAWKKLADCYPN